MIFEVDDKLYDSDYLNIKDIQDVNFSEKVLTLVSKDFDIEKPVFDQPIGVIFKVKRDVYMLELAGIETVLTIANGEDRWDTLTVGKFVHMVQDLKEIDKKIQPFLNTARKVKCLDLYNLFQKVRYECASLIKLIEFGIKTKSKPPKSSGLVKIPDLPSFEVWFTEHGCKYILNHGDYYIAIAQTGWSKKDTTFHFAVATADNPLNIYSSPIFDKVIRVDNNHDDDWYKEELEQWYESTVTQFNKFWVDYIECTYLNERSTNNAGDKNT